MKPITILALLLAIASHSFGQEDAIKKYLTPDQLKKMEEFKKKKGDRKEA